MLLQRTGADMTNLPLSFWLTVASANDVARGRMGGFRQVCHDKRPPLLRISPGDGVVYYSPTEVFGNRTPCQAFTALGFARDTLPYPFDMGGGFVPFRRDVDWLATRPAAIHPLLDQLELTRGQRNWGQPFRYGIVRIVPADFTCIASAMRITPAQLASPCAA